MANFARQQNAKCERKREYMKKVAAIILSALLAVVGIAPASAASTLADGTYAVDLRLMHAEKDQESMGNRYVGQRGLLKVSGGAYQVYIVPADGYDSQFDQVAFKYYQNGSTEGDVLATQTAQNVEIDGVNHAKAVTFTMPNQSGTCGLQFKVPIVGMTVSAKLVIDLNSAQLVEEPATEAPAQQPSAGQQGAGGSQTPAPQETSGQQTPAVDDTQPMAETVSESAPADTTTPAETQPEAVTAEESTTGDPEMVQEDGNTSTVWVIVGVVAAVAVIGGVIAAVVIKKKKS